MRTFTILFLIVLVSACSSAPSPTKEATRPDLALTRLPIFDPTQTPQTGDAAMPSPIIPKDINLQRGNVFISESGILVMESHPVQIALVVSGELPTPCHQFRADITPPDSENRIMVEAYTLVNPNMNCIQVLKPFQENINLGSYPTGHYTVWVNGEKIGEFDS